MTLSLAFSWLSTTMLAAAVVAMYVVMQRQIKRQTHAADVIVALNAMLQAEVDELKRRSEDIEMLSEMSELLQISRSVEEAYDVLPAFGARLFHGLSGAVHVTRTIPGMVGSVGRWGTSRSTPDFATSDCWALRRAHLHTGTAAGIRCPHADKEIGATLCIPMLALGEAIGVVTLNTSDAPSFPAHIEQFAKSFTDQIAFALANLRLQETLRTRAVRDPLTGLFNRRFLEETLCEELDRAGRTQRQVGLMMIDVDHFKRFNDTYGHLGGDALLQQFARQTQRVIADEDVICRFGGEEFVVVMPDANPEIIRLRAEAVLEAARRVRVQLDGHDLAPITVSVGVALSHGRGVSVTELLGAADRALYAAKSSGRDRVSGPSLQIVAA